MPNPAAPSARPIVAILVFGVIAFAFLGWWTSRISVQRQGRATSDCRRRYAEARTAADSGRVDMVYIESSPARGAGRHASVTCGDLRLAGRLAPRTRP